MEVYRFTLGLATIAMAPPHQPRFSSPCSAGLQLGGQRQRVREDLGVVHRHRRGFSEQLPHFGGVLIEVVFAVGVTLVAPIARTVHAQAASLNGTR